MEMAPGLLIFFSLFPKHCTEVDQRNLFLCKQILGCHQKDSFEDFKQYAYFTGILYKMKLSANVPLPMLHQRKQYEGHNTVWYLESHTDKSRNFLQLEI